MAGGVDLFSQDPKWAGAPVEEEKAEASAEEKFQPNEMYGKNPDLFSAEESIEQNERDVNEATEALEEGNNTRQASPISEEAEASEEQEVVEAAADQVSEEASDSVDEVNEEIKKLSAQFGEESLEIPSEAKFKHKVDGEEVEVSVQELLNNYSGKQAWDKKFTELDGERKQYQQELDQVNQFVNEFARKSKDDKIGGLEYLAEIVGIDPLEYKRSLRSDLLNKYGEYLSMDQDQKKMYEQQEELSYLRRRQESEAKQRAEQQAHWELENSYRQIQETHKIDADRRSYLEQELREVYNAEVNPQNLVELHTALTRLDKIDSVLERINPSFIEDNDKILVLESLMKGNPQIQDAELFDYANKIWGNDIQKAVSNLQKKAPKPRKEQPKAQKFKAKVHSTNTVDFF